MFTASKSSRQNQLSLRLLRYVLIISIFFTVVTTGIQTWINYRRAINQVAQSVQYINAFYVPGIAASVYTLDDEQLNIQLQGALNLTGIVYLEVSQTRGDEQISTAAGNSQLPANAIYEFPLEYDALQTEPINYGTLKVIINYSTLYNALWTTFGISLLTNLLSTFLIAFALFIIVQFLLTRHLVTMSAYTENLNFNQLETPLILDRTPSKTQNLDELDKLANAINEMRTRLQTGIEDQKQAKLALSESYNKLEESLQQLEKTQTQLIQQERLAAVGQLSAGIAHDFNNILASISLYTDLTMMTENLPSQIYGRLEIISSQTKRAADLVQQILDFSRQSVFERKPVELTPLINEVVKLLKRTLSDTIQINFDRKLEEFFIDADPTRIQQVLLNLALNARDAMPDGGELNISISHTVNPLIQNQISSGKYVKIMVSDTGIGISPDVLHKIFEPFFTTRAPIGHGLGLAQVYGIINQHNGYIDVKTTLGKGTAFTLYFQSIRKTSLKKHAHTTPATLAGTGETILVVEDDPIVQKVLVDVLVQLGYQTFVANDGQEALLLFEQHQHKIQLVISDWVMPVMGGYELVQKIIQMGLPAKILIITGHPLDQINTESNNDNAIIDWLKKPFTPEQLIRSITRVMHDKDKQELR